MATAIKKKPAGKTTAGKAGTIARSGTQTSKGAKSRDAPITTSETTTKGKTAGKTGMTGKKKPSR